MLNSSAILVICVLLLIGSAAYYQYTKVDPKDEKEGFATAGSGMLTTQVDTTMVYPNGTQVSTPNNTNVFHLKSGSEGAVFAQYPNYQSHLAPRMAGGINVKSDVAKKLNIAVPGDPKTHAQMSTCTCENGVCTGNCAGVGSLREIGELVGGVKENFDGPEGMIQGQPIIYDRNITAISRSRLREHGDPIRGDLHIVPDNHSGWFQVSATPANSLRVGAIGIIAGDTNENSRLVSALASTSAGGRSANPYEEIDNPNYKQIS